MPGRPRRWAALVRPNRGEEALVPTDSWGLLLEPWADCFTPQVVEDALEGGDDRPGERRAVLAQLGSRPRVVAQLAPQVQVQTGGIVRWRRVPVPQRS